MRLKNLLFVVVSFFLSTSAFAEESCKKKVVHLLPYKGIVLNVLSVQWDPNTVLEGGTPFLVQKYTLTVKPPNHKLVTLTTFTREHYQEPQIRKGDCFFYMNTVFGPNGVNNPESMSDQWWYKIMTRDGKIFTGYPILTSNLPYGGDPNGFSFNLGRCTNCSALIFNSFPLQKSSLKPRPLSSLNRISRRTGHNFHLSPQKMEAKAFRNIASPMNNRTNQ